MSIAMMQRIKALEAKLQELQGKQDSALAERVRTLEAKYVMLNARLSKKNNNGGTQETDGS